MLFQGEKILKNKQKKKSFNKLTINQDALNSNSIVVES